MSVAGELITAADRVADRVIFDLEALRRIVVRDMVRVLRRLPVTDEGAIAARAELRNLGAVRSAVLALLEDEGAAPSVSLLEAAVADASRAAVDVLRRTVSERDPLFAPEFVPAPEFTLFRQTAGATAEIARLFGIAQDEIRVAINVGTTTGVPLDELIAFAAQRAGVAFSRVKAAVETAVIGAGRAVVADATGRANAAAGEDRFLLRYVGPLDRKTRSFCRGILTGVRVFTEAAVAGLDNGQGLDVRRFCGGYRCRHQWAPITIYEVQRRGWAVAGTPARRLAA